MSIPVLIILSVVFTTSIAIPLILFVHKRNREFLERISSIEGAQRSGNRIRATLEDGSPYRYEYYAGSRNSPSRFQIAVPCSSDFEFTMKPEKNSHRFFKKIGISREIQTGDEFFDNKVYISTNSDDMMREFLQEEKVRDLILKIFSRDFNQIILNGREIIANISPFKNRGNFQTSVIQNVAEDLKILSNDLPDAPRKPVIQTTPDWKIKRAAAFAVPILTETLGLIMLITGLVKYSPLDKFSIIMKGALYGLPFLILFIPFAVNMVKGRAKSHIELIIILIISITGFPLLGAGTLVFLNGALDYYPPENHSVLVTRKYTSRSDKSTYYHLVTQSWRNRSGEDFKVQRAMYNAAVPNESVLDVVTHRGRFGYEWVEKFRIR